jgi:hypothetical protein
MTEEIDDLKPWERQPWETATYFRRFHTFYLPQNPPRSVNKSFRLFKLHGGHEVEPNKTAPGSWRYMSRGMDKNGIKIKNALTWVERADLWDKHLTDIANAEVEARWAKQIMGKTEVLGRLSQQGRINIGEFYTTKQVPFQDLEGNAIVDENGNIQIYEVFEIDWAFVKENGQLIKSITPTRYGNRLELHDGQSALVHMGKSLKLFTENIDLTSNGQPLQTMENLNDDQFSCAVGNLAQIGLAVAGRKSVPATTSIPEGDDPAG